MKFNALYHLRNNITALPLNNSRLGALQTYLDGTRPFGFYHPHGLLSDCCLETTQLVFHSIIPGPGLGIVPRRSGCLVRSGYLGGGAVHSHFRVEMLHVW